MTMLSNIISGTGLPSEAGLPTVPRGPGNNLPGSRTTTSTTAPAALGRGSQRDLTIASLLGQVAQAIQPEGIGARLGAVAVEGARDTRIRNALARSLAGEELTPEDLTGLGAEDVEQIESLTERAQRRRFEREKRLEESQGAELERRAKALANIREGAEAGLSDEVLAGMAREAGIEPGSADFKGATERQKELLAAQGTQTIEQIKQRGVEDIELENQKHQNRMLEIDKEIGGRLKAIEAQVGKDVEQLAKYNAALRTVSSFKTEISTPEELAIVFEDALRANGLGEMADQMQGETWLKWAAGINVPRAGGAGVQEGTKGVSQAQLDTMYGPKKAGNPYNPNDPVELLGYAMFQQGNDISEIAPILMPLLARRSNQPTPTVSETTRSR